MALTKNIEYKFITVENAYLKIENLTGNKESITFYLSSYKDFEASKDGKNVLSTHMIKFIPDNSETSLRWDRQAYDYAKTLPEYSDAIDV